MSNEQLAMSNEKKAMRIGVRLFVVNLLLCGVCFNAFAQERTAIAVFPFEDMENLLTKNESILFYQRFSNEFANKNNGRFRIVPRQDVEKLIGAEYNFQLTRFSAQTKTAEMERVLNGSQILSGRIGKFNNKIAISISLYTYPDLEQLPGGVDIDVANKDELFTKIPDLVQSMMTAIAGGNTNQLANRLTQNQTAIPANFVLVEGGTFQMGTPSGGNDDERPVHTVTVKSFYMSKYEVTQKEWQEIMENNPSSFIGENLPVENVSWHDAVEYCNKRSLKEGLTPAYRGSGDNITCDWNANGYRLPTEAEWEFAAKGGTKDYLTTVYSGNNNVDAVAWYDGNSGKKTQPKDTKAADTKTEDKLLGVISWLLGLAVLSMNENGDPYLINGGSTQPVGTKAPNSLGIYDMSGNVWEWCWDRYGSYSNGSQADPRGPGSGAGRVMRGGSWSDSATSGRSANRGNGTPSSRYSVYGFRLVRN